MKKDQRIIHDLFRYEGRTSFKTFLKYYFLNPCFKYTFWLRKASYHSGHSFLGIIFRLILNRLKSRYGIQISPDTEIGAGFYICHFGNIVINRKTTIGKNCNIFQGVTIGQADRGKLKGCPIIKNSVWIGPNSVIVGKIVVGNNVLIGPGSFVNFDIPDNSIVVNNAARVAQKKNATEYYINNKV